MEAGGFDFKVCLGNIAKPCLQNRNINCVYTKQNEKKSHSVLILREMLSNECNSSAMNNSASVNFRCSQMNH